ncbi:MAG: hypothetical protein P9M03_03550 [Candidatus Theseobacter exili]|nr:hypothetical protein [Candidatus Theseobacter exili]
MKKILIAFVFMVSFIYSIVNAAEPKIKIMRYPRSLTPGETAYVEVYWSNVENDGNYKLIVQLENWDIKPGICYISEETNYKKSDRKRFAIKIPKNAIPSSECRFLATFLSKSSGWKDVLGPVESTPKNVTIRSLLKIDIYPRVVIAGSKPRIKVSWNSFPNKDNYKLLVQLENWSVKPGICYKREIQKFNDAGTGVVVLRVPSNAKAISNCRFVAAFLSKTRGWDDSLSTVRTEKDVAIVRPEKKE